MNKEVCKKCVKWKLSLPRFKQLKYKSIDIKQDSSGQVVDILIEYDSGYQRKITCQRFPYKKCDFQMEQMIIGQKNVKQEDMQEMS